MNYEELRKVCECTWNMNNDGKYCRHCLDLLRAEGIECGYNDRGF